MPAATTITRRHSLEVPAPAVAAVKGLRLRRRAHVGERAIREGRALDGGALSAGAFLRLANDGGGSSIARSLRREMIQGKGNVAL